MGETKKDIVLKLQQQILKMQGFKSVSEGRSMDFGLGVLTDSFPNQVFPTSAVHEFIGTNLEDAAATGGFISALLSTLMQSNGTCIWISTSRKIFPPSLAVFNISPDRIIFVDLQKEKDVLWASEESLKCVDLCAVITEIDEISFAQSRRLQLVIEKSKVTSFIIRKHAEKLSATTAVARWKISALPSETIDGMPGLGFPRWNVELLKIKNGIPGNWIMEYSAGQFLHIKEEILLNKEIRTAI